jgi:glucose-6-phosphate 1-dehydrogenase
MHGYVWLRSKLNCADALLFTCSCVSWLLLCAGNGQPGYLEDPTVPAGSRAPTYAACRLQINNERWAGVPFVLRAGKALNERSVVVRIQLHENPVPLFGPHAAHQHMRNEFVMRLQPGARAVSWARCCQRDHPSTTGKPAAADSPAAASRWAMFGNDAATQNFLS